MTIQLRDEFQRLGDAAPRLDVSTEAAWRRGRTLRRRHRLTVVAAAVGVLALVGGLAWTTPRGAEPQPAGSTGAPGVPGRLWTVPQRFLETGSDRAMTTRWHGVAATTDLRLGRVAAVFTQCAQGCLPVAVDATSGRYHLLDLPGLVDAGSFNATFTRPYTTPALSPDGRWLAWGYWDPTTPDTQPMRSGLRYADLTTGRVTSVPLTGGNGIQVHTLAWSPNASWLAWSGVQTRVWVASNSTAGDPVAGRVHLPGTTSDRFPMVSQTGDDGAIAVSDVGEVAMWDGATLRRWGGTGDGRLLSTGQPVPGLLAMGRTQNRAGAYSPNGTKLVLWVGDGPRFVTAELADGSAHLRTTMAGLYSRQAGLHPIGWSADRHVISVVDPGAGQPAQLVLSTPERGSQSTWRIVGRLDPAIADSLTVATDLMTLDRPTVDRPAPHWPWTWQRRATVWGGGVLAAGLAAYLLLSLRRRRRP